MTVFISWSGPLSKAVAELLNSWLPDVIQGVKTWFSPEHIEKGAIWSSEINDALSTSVGVLCVTQENKNAPWVLFEAGGLSKGLTKARVCPLLIDLEPKDLQPPLSTFQLTLVNREDVEKLLGTINAADKDAALDKDRLRKSFNRLWPEFESELNKIREAHKTSRKAPERSEKELIAEILDIVRALQRTSERAESGEGSIFYAPPLSSVNAPPLSSVELTRISEMLKKSNPYELEVNKANKKPPRPNPDLGPKVVPPPKQ
jgi:TIR domain-containing protein